MKKIIYGLAFFHLTLMTLSVFHLTDKILYAKQVAIPLNFLTSLNYSAWRYGFFSPDVGKSVEVNIDLPTFEGEVKHFSTGKGFDFYTANQEAENRFYNLKIKTAADTAFQDLIIRSVSTKILNEEMDAVGINFNMRSIRFPTMVEYRNGVAPDSSDFYQIAFGLY